VLSIRKLEEAAQDKLLIQPFTLYGTSVKLNIDNRIDMAERVIVAQKTF
jgi:hypothetical protein